MNIIKLGRYKQDGGNNNFTITRSELKGLEGGEGRGSIEKARGWETGKKKS